MGGERWRVGVWQVTICGLLTRVRAMLGPVHHAHRDLSFNQLSGSIPDAIGKLTQLTLMCVGCCVLACCAVWACGLMGSEGVGDARWRVGAWQGLRCERSLGFC